MANTLGLVIFIGVGIVAIAILVELYANYLSLSATNSPIAKHGFFYYLMYRKR